jgi:two-component system OmpR family response regulator
MSPNSPARILLIEDEKGIREMVREVLAIEGYAVEIAVDGQEALSLLRKERFDLMVVDLNLPKLNGFDLLEKVRKDGDDTPALIVTARGDKEDVTRGLRLGADDYVKKPFGIEELLLRINAILRRSGKSKKRQALVVGPLTMNISKHELHFKDELISLSPTEFRLLQNLMENENKVIAKDVLLRTVWEFDFENNSTVVDTYISYLRKKLHKDGFAGIKTVRGIGFQLTAE